MRFLMPFLLKLLPSKPVFAHCDIPCGIYDPHTAQLASQTVLKMVQKMKALPKDDIHSLIRMVSVKEDHAELCKREILILWTDYYQSEHLEKFPDLHELVWKACKLCSDNKTESTDSRHFGQVDQSQITGKVLYYFHDATAAR